MGIVMIIQLLYETAVILLLLMDSVGQGIQRQPIRDGLSLLHRVWGLSERRLIWLRDGSSVGFCPGMSGASP